MFDGALNIAFNGERQVSSQVYTIYHKKAVENVCAYGSSYPVFNVSWSERYLIFIYLLRNQRLRNHPQVLGCVALPLHRCLPVEDPLLLPIW